MDPKTMFACLFGKRRHHRLTIPDHIKKRIDRQVAAEAERHRCGGAKPNRGKAHKRKKVARYGSVTPEKRIQIETLRRQGYCNSEIAKVIGCHRSTVGREIDRNKSHKGYRNKKA